jgi:ATPase family AAA domain-containing protein 5
MAASVLSQISALQHRPPTLPFDIFLQFQSTPFPAPPLSRKSFASLDPLGVPPSSSFAAGSSNILCSIDREFRVMATDIAPYVRSIAAYDLELDAEKARLLLSLDGRPPRKVRLTRVSRNALEGGRREEMRKERWFSKELNLRAVVETGSREWMRARNAVTTDGRSTRDSERRSDDDDE